MIIFVSDSETKCMFDNECMLIYCKLLVICIPLKVEKCIIVVEKCIIGCNVPSTFISKNVISHRP